MSARRPPVFLPRPLADLVRHPSRGGCGVGAIGDPAGKSREVLDWALAGLDAMEHRGGSIDDTGDGAGLLLGVDPAWFGRFVAHGKHVPEGDQLSVGTVFFPPGEAASLRAWQDEIDSLLRREGLAPLGWRRVPVDERALGKAARESRREPWQVLIGEGLSRGSGWRSRCGG
jgi:glutamate synthase domain-containing protein 1